MKSKYYYTTEEVAELLGCGLSYAGKYVRQLNAEVAAMGKIPAPKRGLVLKSYLHERFSLGEVIEK